MRQGEGGKVGQGSDFEKFGNRKMKRGAARPLLILVVLSELPIPRCRSHNLGITESKKTLVELFTEHLTGEIKSSEIPIVYMTCRASSDHSILEGGLLVEVVLGDAAVCRWRPYRGIAAPDDTDVEHHSLGPRLQPVVTRYEWLLSGRAVECRKRRVRKDRKTRAPPRQKQIPPIQRLAGRGAW